MNTPSRPLAIRLLHWFCPAQLVEEIEGDLLQRFEKETKMLGPRKAKRRLLWNAIRFFRPGILLRNKLSVTLNSTDMLSNYFKVALRVMFRSKTYSFINIFGLALGITGFSLLFLWIQREFTFDQFHADKHRIYKAWNRDVANGKISSWDVTPRVLAPTLLEEYAGVESAISYSGWGEQHLFIQGDKRLVKNTGAYTDEAFLTMFSFPLVKGDASTAFKNPNSIVITEKFAKELFGDKEAFGETVSIGEPGENLSLTITGILKDLPLNTDFKFEYLISYSLVESIGGKQVQWGNNSVYTYVKLKEGADLATFNEEVKGIVKKHEKEADQREVFLYPLEKMRLYSRFENGVPAGGRIEIMRMLGILGVCLLAIACINFINLSTARAQRRSKEVAVRKVSGAFRNSLVAQFLCESILIAFAAGVLSLLAIYLALPFFSSLVGQQITLDFSNTAFWIGAIIFILLIGLIAGSYPALYLSSFRPARILKGATISSAAKSTLRATLVVFQFGLATSLIISAIVIQRQIRFVQERDSGYRKDNLVYQYLSGSLGKNYEAYKNELLQSGVAEVVTKTSQPITNRWSNSNGIGWRGKDPQNKTLFERFYVDNDFITTAGLTLVEGRDMDLSQFPSDSTAALLNEAAAKAMGFDQPLGEVINDDGQDWQVIGVVKDFILTSPFRPVEPVIILGCKQSWAFNVIHTRLNPNKPIQESIRKLSELTLKYSPDYPVEYNFVDQEYERKFANMEATRSITLLASALTILIAGLGLLGLSTFMIEVRVKEIGIRKVMGGSVLSITRLLSLASLKPILIAIAIFSPMSWFAMDWWLSSYAYRISIGVFTIPLAAFTIIFIALLITSVQTIRAARANPVNSLRNE